LAGTVVLLLCCCVGRREIWFFTVTVIYMIFCICSQGRTNVDIFKRKKPHGTALAKMTVKLRHENAVISDPQRAVWHCSKMTAGTSFG